MLTLTRRVGETLVVEPFSDVDPGMTIGELFSNGPIIIAIHAVHNRNQVRLGIEAPDELSVVRTELIETT